MKLHRLEISLATALAILLLFPMSSQGNPVSDKIVRLHIVAENDSVDEQCLKLAVRDAVNGFVAKSDEISPEKLPLGDIREVAQSAVYSLGFSHSVAVELADMHFDTRIYEGFALPSGVYRALRITIGSGSGKNWWCVMFPPLCTGLATASIAEVAKKGGLSRSDIGLITRDGVYYKLRFKLLELFDK